MSEKLSLEGVFVDSHVNLHSEQYEPDELDSLIARAKESGVRYMLTISDKLSSTPAITKIANDHSFIWRSTGVHPHYAKDYADLEAATLIELADDAKVVGIGECGLDFHYEYSERAFQERVFAAHIEAAQETGLPLIIHTREADELMMEMLERAYAKAPFVSLLHCYTSGEKLARLVLEDMGGYISFSGIITFKNANDVRAIAALAPLDRIIIETDCPYLAPVPMRGRRNEPAYLPHVAAKLGEIRGCDQNEIAGITTQNFFRLFSKIKQNDVR